MITYADKTQENRSQSNTESVSQKRESDPATFQFANNRPEAIQMQQLQEMANQHSANNAPNYQHNTAPIQLKTEVIHNSGIQQYEDKNGDVQGQLVGKSMFAYLDPYDPLVGTESDVFERNGIYLDPTYVYKDDKKNKYAKGPTAMHLLNAHLGGLAIDINLFPQRSTMNRDHLNVAEYNAKAKLLTLRNYTPKQLKGARVYYGVVVEPAAKVLKPDNVKDSRFYVYGPTYVDKNNEPVKEDWETNVEGDLNEKLNDKGWTQSDRNRLRIGNRKNLNSPNYEGPRNHFEENIQHYDERAGDPTRRTHHHDSRGPWDNGEEWDEGMNDF
jgi:hypothetical protein